MDAVRNALEQLEMGEALAFGDFRLFPLFGKGEAADVRPYLVLDEALADDLIHITEVSEGGSVPELRLTNKADKAVLLLDGEELMGAKQNRVLNFTVLAPPREEILIPVTCVERGRWGWKDRYFSKSSNVLYSKARHAKLRAVAQSMERGRYEADQGQVWEDIADKSQRMGCRSGTEAMSDLYDSRRRDLEAYVAKLAWQEGQVGAVFAVGGRVAGMELFDHPDGFRLFAEKIVKSYALDAVEPMPGKSGIATEVQAADFLHQLGQAHAVSGPGIGLGESVRIAGVGFDGAALAYQDRVLHMSAFSRNGQA